MLRVIPIFLGCLTISFTVARGEDRVDFNRQIRPLLSNRCFACHGPDENERKADLRLDTPEGALADLGGYAALIPGDAEKSELFLRISSTDEDEVMPPPEKGKPFSPEEVALFQKWIDQGGEYEVHWSYVKPVKAELPAVADAQWPLNEIDRFLLDRLEKEGLKPIAEADRRTLARRVALDLTGLPPSWEEVEAFVNDATPGAYESLVEATLKKPTFGEHWARTWLDQARYADSSGYPSDQPREIWGYRDWVIGALNRNLSFDRFTIEQLAGDLLPNPDDSQLIATAFHRNTMTQNEGGTSDEEFRTAAVVDRVNTTMEVWMGTTMACAQCHTHKFDPISQTEYFQVFAILNQSADADRKDEAPLHQFYTRDQERRRTELQTEIDQLETRFAHAKPTDFSGLPAWEKSLPVRAAWLTPKPVAAKSVAGAALVLAENGKISASKPEAEKDTVTVELPVEPGSIEAVRLEVLADDQLPAKGPGHANGNFVVSQIRADFVPDDAKPIPARRLRLEVISKKYHFLELGEVQVFSGAEVISSKGKANQISTNPNGPKADLAIDGNPATATKTGGGEGAQWWELTFEADQPIDRVVIQKRAKGYLEGLRLTLFDQQGNPVWESRHEKPLGDREEFTVSGRRELRLSKAFADATQGSFDPSDVLAEKSDPGKGWAVGGFTGEDRALTLLTPKGFAAEKPGRLVVTLKQESRWAHHLLGAFRIGVSREPNIRKLGGIPAPVLSALTLENNQRNEEETKRIREYYLREVAPELNTERQRLAALRKERDGIQPASVPIMQALPEKDRRITKIQRRGSWKDLGDEVGPGVPAAFHPLPKDRPTDRLALAQWLVSQENPLTARVLVNRLWEAIFGIGIVRTSEEFGAQGELPIHPELLDWLAADFMEHGWDVKRLLTQMVTSRAYRQDSRSTPELNERDPDNRLLARGPRFRPTGEQLRDQALAVSGLLSGKMGGPAVRPMAPKLGLSTAFGRSNDWTVSPGEDSHRRSVYTEVRRNSPYASFSTFDAPNRETCTISRDRTNTPLQAFVTLNDPVFVEANQALARRLVNEMPEGDVAERSRLAYRVCLSRDPWEDELETLGALFGESLAALSADADAAAKLATDPIGPVPPGANTAELAAWTATVNVIMNLDEFLMRR